MSSFKMVMGAWSKKHTVLLGAALGVASAAFLAGRALAAGVPDVEPLTYSGTLMSSNGEPLSGDRAILLRFWDKATDGDVLCTRPEETVALSVGRFSLALPDECTDAVRANPDLWVEIVVDDVSLGLAKVGAVPFAIEATHAVTADRPNLMSLVHLASEFADVRINTTTLPTANTWTLVTGRTLTFNKKFANSLLKITYQDTLGTLGTKYNGCQWRILLDGTTLGFFSDGDSGGNGVASYGWKMTNASHVFWSKNAAAGKRTVTVEWRGTADWVTAGADGTTECLSGWNTDGNFLSVEEIP
jgi:hypothetical protein